MQSKSAVPVDVDPQGFQEMSFKPKPVHIVHSQPKDIIRTFEGFVVSIQYLKGFV